MKCYKFIEYYLQNIYQYLSIIKLALFNFGYLIITYIYLKQRLISENNDRCFYFKKEINSKWDKPSVYCNHYYIEIILIHV